MKQRHQSTFLFGRRTRAKGTRRRPIFSVLSLLALVLAACTSGSSEATTTTSTAVTSTTQPVSTTTIPGTTTTDTSGPTTTTGGSVGDGASGSGCTPGEGDLPDGEWYGLVAGATETHIEFDLACWFTGEAAVKAAAEDGEESPPPNDYYVRNANPELRNVAVDSDIEVTWYPQFGDPGSEAVIAYEEWVGALADRGEFLPGVWIEIQGGEVTEIREQWVP